MNGAVGLVVAPGGRLFRVLSFRFDAGRIVEVEVIGDPERLGALNLAVIRDSGGDTTDIVRDELDR